MTETIRARILIVDDERGPRESLRMILVPNHEVLCARNGSEALEVLATTPIDLVTLDLNMPGVKGDALMHTIRAEFPQVEIIVITGYGTLESAAEGVRAGVCDYLQKPFDVVQVTAAVNRALSRRRGRRRLVGFLETLGELLGRDRDVRVLLHELEANPLLREEVTELLESAGRAAREDGEGGRRTLELLELLAVTIESQVESMRGHARRASFYAGQLADRLGLGGQEVEELRIAAFLHDLGKIGIPSDLLLRPAALSMEEQALVHRHPEIGARLVQPIGVAPAVVSTIRHHHERWDGGGYPNGLGGEEIPLGARIIAVVDAFDAMSTDRPYRPALAPEAVRRELTTCAGTQFDPALAKEFLGMLDAGLCDGDLEAVADAISLAARPLGSGGAGRAVDATREDAR
ncbi:MAG: HD domain-containing phosphohydrolase [Myxococcota bacterium]